MPPDPRSQATRPSGTERRARQASAPIRRSKNTNMHHRLLFVAWPTLKCDGRNLRKGPDLHLGTRKVPEALGCFQALVS